MTKIYDLVNAEIKSKIPEINRVSLWPPSNLDLVDYAIWGVLENKQIQLPMQTLIRIRLR